MTEGIAERLELPRHAVAGMDLDAAVGGVDAGLPPGLLVAPDATLQCGEQGDGRGVRHDPFGVLDDVCRAAHQCPRLECRAPPRWQQGMADVGGDVEVGAR